MYRCGQRIFRAFTNFVKSVRDKYPTKTIIAGNVVTADMTQELVLSGADTAKGIGPGSVCTTRIQTDISTIKRCN